MDGAAALAYPRRPSVLRCALAIAAVKLGLRLGGFSRTWRAIVRLTAHQVWLADVHPRFVHDTARAVATAAAFFPGRALCLEQSLVLWYCLRRRRVHAQLRLGVQAAPFASQAWVEYLGEPIDEDKDRLAQFSPLPDLPA